MRGVNDLDWEEIKNITAEGGRKVKEKMTAQSRFCLLYTSENRKPDVENLVPGDFYSMLSIYEKDTFIGYIGFNIFDPYEDPIPEEQYYQTVYPGLRLSSVFHWDPYEAVKTTDTAETGIADIWYLEPGEIDKHPGRCV